ncbi:hypothetical protein OIU78_015142 [Salix suchowensis]|nr:hypothetical protein OIU78_015142 [Salix suchowensis]
MEDSFKVRVDKTFGSLSSYSSSIHTQQPSSSLSSVWCLTDEEIERNQWNRDHKDSPETKNQPQPYFNPEIRDDTSCNSETEEDLVDLADEEDKVESSRPSKLKPEDCNDEEWDIKKSIGLDSTLDYEEEEDHYDKVAVGTEEPGDDRLYLTQMNDYGIDEDSGDVMPMPSSFGDLTRDLRANHLTAKIRLQEDAETAKKMDSLRVTEMENIGANDDGNLKSIMKRKKVVQSDSMSISNHLDSKLQKRVRFDPECKDGNDEESSGVEDIQMETTDSTEETLIYHLPPDYPSGIPDYMRNPSKYTRYAFDSAPNVDEESNQGAYMDFLKILQRPNTTESHPDEVPADLSRPLTFIPKRKNSGAAVIDNCIDSKQNQDDAGEDFKLRRGVPLEIAAFDDNDAETFAMEEDKPETAADKTNSSRPARQYRSKAKSET